MSSDIGISHPELFRCSEWFSYNRANFMAITIGQQLGSYEITALLGKGGMGEVYRARDTKLKREVAIKILPDEFSLDADRVSRFQREAEVLALLNHPNIAAIYDLQKANDTRFLVLELVEGQTLADRIQQGAIAVEEALTIAHSVCQALEAAHERAIIHRDLKPANVKITPHGRVKVLDFGLAKASAPEGLRSNLMERPTISAELTEAGRILGTPAYMSPEQVRGKPLDKRVDIWAFGCLLYEMLSCQRAFAGETSSEAVLERQPNWVRCLHPHLRKFGICSADASKRIRVTAFMILPTPVSRSRRR